MEDRVILISYSQNKEGLSLENMICYCARVSNPTNQILKSYTRNDKLLQYLIRNEHWSPFEMVSICLEINTTRDIARQILRHRSFSFQEFSQRYAAVDQTQTPFLTRETRLQDHTNRQNSLPPNTNNVSLTLQWQERQEDVLKVAQGAYNWAIENGLAKEIARTVLPEGMTPSRLYMNGTLRSWIHYIRLRSGNGTQKEHQEIAIQCARVIETIFPLIISFLS